MLVLFDIDGTLLRTGGAGIRAMEDAGRELFGPEFSYDGIETAGRLDTLIWQDLARRNNIAGGEEHHDRFRATYGRLLQHHLAATNTMKRMPGVKELIEALIAMRRATLGLLTGNYPETGRMKVAAAGLDPDVFTVNAWGGDGLTRRDLPPVAMKRHAQIMGRTIAPDQVVIIGDTPHDVDCAKAHGCRSLAVATGWSPLEALVECGPDLAVADLSDTAAIVHWLMGSTGSAGGSGGAIH